MDDPHINCVGPDTNANTPPAEAPKGSGLISQVPAPVKSNGTITSCKPDQTPAWKMILETAAVFVGMYVAGIYHGQLKVMQGQLGEIIKQYPELQKSANAANSAAVTAKQTLDSNQQQFRADQRPYLWADPVGAMVNTTTKVRYVLQPLNDGGVAVHASVHIKNGGKSPAIDLATTEVIIKVGPAEQVEQEAMHYTGKYLGGSQGILMPGIEMEPYTPSARQPVLTAQQAGWLNDGTWKMYIMGKVSYRDIFSPRLNSPYETKYCFIFAPVGLAFGGCAQVPGYIH